MPVDYVAVLVVALLAVTAAGVGVTVVSIVWLMRRQDTAIHTMERDHSNEIAQIEQKHQRETEALRARTFMLESQQAITLQLLQERNVFLPADVAHVKANGRNDPVFTALRDLFTMEQLEVLAADIGIRLETLGGQSLPVVAKRLMEEASRDSKYGALVGAIRLARPNAGV
jgi:hypothetical protein